MKYGSAHPTFWYGWKNSTDIFVTEHTIVKIRYWIANIKAISWADNKTTRTKLCSCNRMKIITNTSLPKIITNSCQCFLKHIKHLLPSSFVKLNCLVVLYVKNIFDIHTRDEFKILVLPYLFFSHPNIYYLDRLLNCMTFNL